jgi:primosomal protein N' (replication factor Y)
MPFVEIAVDFPDDRSRTFTYAVPDRMSVIPGDLVWVPFGTRVLQGVVFAQTQSEPDVETRSLLSLVDDGPFLDLARLRLARWIATYYRTPLFIACSLMLPPGSRTRLRTWIRQEPENFPPEITLGRDLRPHEQRVIATLSDGNWQRKDRVARKLGRTGNATVDRMLRRGIVESRHEWELPRARAAFSNVLALTAPPETTANLISQYEETRSSKRADLLKHLSAAGSPQPRPQLAKQFGSTAVKWAIDAGAVELQKVRVERDPLSDYAVQQQFPFDPTPAQAGAIQAITAAIDTAQRPPGRFLLYGVTGSGKTEVYLQAAAHCLQSGKKVLVLVPEIALTPQTLQRFASRFPGRVALLHSGLSNGERFDQWWGIRKGRYDVVLGSRGAVFAPVSDLGLIVIDEEHEWTYKQHDQAPRYHARDAAELLALETGASLVLGSATPSVTTFRRAERGEVRILRLPDRPSQITGLAPSVSPDGPNGRARVRVVDMRQELRDRHTEILSRDLLDAMRRALNAGGKVILYLNRRGTSGFVQCTTCGIMRQCRRCDNTLTHHAPTERRPARLECHFCGYRVRASRACPACGGNSVKRTGPGTERVVEVVNAHFPRAGSMRWDSDTARTFKDHMELLKRFTEGEPRVLVGTQMVAKGLDIPAVTLVGAVSADIGLAVPDFLAAERSFQLLAQVSGRAGRGPTGGEVVIQTMQPDHYAIQAAAAQDYELFYQQEMEIRARHDLPPYSRLIRLRSAGPDAVEAHEKAYDTAARFDRRRKISGLSGVKIIGPTPAVPLRVRGFFRWQIVLKGAAPEQMLDEEPVGADWSVDVDPVSLT